MPRVLWSPSARLRLNEVVDYIALDSPEAAQSVHRAIVQSVRRLEQWPLSSPWIGAVFPQLEQLDESFRVLVVRPYLVFFRVVGDEVRILTVRHGAQLPPLPESLEQ